MNLRRVKAFAVCYSFESGHEWMPPFSGRILSLIGSLPCFMYNLLIQMSDYVEIVKNKNIVFLGWPVPESL